MRLLRVMHRRGTCIARMHPNARPVGTGWYPKAPKGEHCARMAPERSSWNEITASAPRATRGFSPLDVQLGLLPGCLTPRLVEGQARLGVWIPSFRRASELLEYFTGVHSDESVARHNTEAAGAVYVEQQQEEAIRLEKECPPAPQGADKVQISADGVFVPLVGGDWMEVKTLAVGVVGEPEWEQGRWQVHTRELSYFSRGLSSEEFTRQSLVETRRRGVETAPLVCAPMDGALWLQEFVDWRRPDAVRILDFCHAAQRIAEVAPLAQGPGDPEGKVWLHEQLQQLQKKGPSALLETLRALHQQHPHEEKLRENLAYLEKRENQCQYPKYQALGLPIGSGIVESGNKEVVEGRLKGPGMHWAREHVDPIVALRDMACSDRWEEAWPLIEQGLRTRAGQRRQQRHEQRQDRCQSALIGQVQASQPPSEPPSAPRSTATLEACPAQPKAPASKRSCVPGPSHPWRRPFLTPKPCSN